MDYNISFITNTIDLYIDYFDSSTGNIQLSKSDININNNNYHSIILEVSLSLMREKGFRNGLGFCTLYNYKLKFEIK